jgi:predicted dehydrogenase
MYLPALRSHPQAELAAICGRNQQRAADMAGKYGIASVFTDYNAMIEQAKLDAVIVSVPDDLHYEVTMRALDAKLHVLCEKPFALTAHAARAMYEKAEAVGVKHMVLFTYRWLPFFRYFRDLVDQDIIGRLYHAEFHYVAGYGRRQEYAWRLDRKRANGVLGDLGSHLIDMARWLVGDVTRVSAQLAVCVDRPGPDGGPIDPANDSALLLAEFANGAHGVIQASCVAHLADYGQRQEIRLYGEAGTLEITVAFEGPEAGAVIRAARSRETQLARLTVPDSYWGDVDRSKPFEVFIQQSVGTRLFIDAILDNRPIVPGFYEGYQVQRVIDAALASHAAGCVVRIGNLDR